MNLNNPEVRGKSRFTNYALRSLITLTWNSIAASITNVAPSTDTEIDVSKAKSIFIQCDTTDASNISTDVDINVHSTLDGSNWDTVPFTSQANIGDAVIIALNITPGMQKIRLRADNNDGANVAKPVVRVFIRE